jgi:hypothetical protein
MNCDITLKIEFSRHLNEIEQSEFCKPLVEEIEKLNLRFKGELNETQLEWVIDYSNSIFDKSKIIDKIGDSLLERDKLILNYEIK